MIPQPRPDEEIQDLDVRYGIADCRKRLRSQRATLRAFHQTPTDVTSREKELSGRDVKSYAEILVSVSMQQDSISRLVDCLLGPAHQSASADESVDRSGQEAAVT